MIRRGMPAELRGPAAFAAGLLLWWVAVRLGAVAMPSGSLEQARALGLVSMTVLAGYDEAQEARAWLLGCVLIPGAVFLLGRAGGRRPREPDAPLPRWLVAVGPLTIVAAAARPELLRGPNPWGSFGFLGEEGVYLGAAQALDGGRLLYRDLEFPYGPWLLLPLRWALDTFGETVVVARAVVLAGHLAGVAAVFGAVRLLAGPARGALLGLVAAALVVGTAPLSLPNLNGILLRPALALLAPALAVAATRRGDVRLAALAGATAVLGGLISFEVGAAAVFGVGAALALAGGGRLVLGALAGALGTLVAGIALVLPSVGLRALPDQASRMLQLPALGYQALPYPDPAGLFVDGAGSRGAYPPADEATWLWAVLPPLVLWAGLAAGVARGRWGARPGPWEALGLAAACSAVLFRAPLGRSDLYHCWFYGAVPTVVVGVLLLDRLAVLGRQALTAAVTVGLLFLVGARWVDAEQVVRFPDSEEVRLAEQAGITDDPLGQVPVRLARAGGLRVHPRLAARLQATVARVAALPRDDGVWFHPSESAFYFLCDRPLPHRYLWAYDAATPALQAHAIAELEANPPRWLVRATDTFPIDWIPQHQLVPALEGWIESHYRPVEALLGAELLEYLEPARP